MLEPMGQTFLRRKLIGFFPGVSIRRRHIDDGGYTVAGRDNPLQDLTPDNGSPTASLESDLAVLPTTTDRPAQYHNPNPMQSWGPVL